MSEPVVQVFVFRDGVYVGSEVFSEPELVLGSGEGADLLIDDSKIGDAHAILAREGTELRLLDLGHAGGTRINGSAIEHAHVGPRDEIGIGRHILKVKLVRARSEEQSPSRRPSLSSPPPRRPPPERSIKTEVVRKRGGSADIDALLAEELDGLFGEDSPEASTAAATQVTSMSAAYGSVDEALADAFDATSPLPSVDLDAAAAPPAFSPGAEEPATVRAPLDELQSASPRRLPEFLEPEKPSGPTPDLPTPDLVGSSSPSVLPNAAMSAPRLPPAQAPSPIPPPADTSVSPPPGAHTSSSSLPQVARVSSSDDDHLSAGMGARPHVSSSSLPAAARTSASGLPAARASASGLPAGGFPEVLAPELDLYEDDLEEEDPDVLESREAPGFSLLESLVRATPAPLRGLERGLEVINSDGGQVRSLDLLNAEHRQLDVAGPKRKLRLAKFIGPEEAEIRFPREAAGVLITDGQHVPLDELKTTANAVSRAEEVFSFRLKPSQSLTLRVGDEGYHLRFVEPPPVAKPPTERPSFRGPVPRALGSSVLVHLATAILVGLTVPSVSFSDQRTEVWAEAEPDEVRPVELPPPEPEPKPEPAPEPEAEAPPPEPKPKPKPRRARPQPKPKKRAPARPPKAKKAGVLGGLAKLKKGGAIGGQKSLVAAVSNIDATRTPGGSSYRVGPLIAKAPTSKLRLGGGDGRKSLTRGAAELMRGDGFAKISKKKGARVRGKVSGSVGRKVSGKGQISREEVRKVIDAHRHEVQSCYDRALISNPSLRGKLTVEWTIGLDGRATRIRQKFSTLRSPQVASCIMKKMRRWKFPRPRGGVVVVSNPFTFAPVSY